LAVYLAILGLSPVSAGIIGHVSLYETPTILLSAFGGTRRNKNCIEARVWKVDKYVSRLSLSPAFLHTRKERRRFVKPLRGAAMMDQTAGLMILTRRLQMGLREIKLDEKLRSKPYAAGLPPIIRVYESHQDQVRIVSRFFLLSPFQCVHLHFEHNWRNEVECRCSEHRISEMERLSNSKVEGCGNVEV
jgi:hypothetical protein